MNQAPFTAIMVDDSKIAYCQECKTWTYRYNGQQCPICYDKREREKIAREKERLERLKAH